MSTLLGPVREQRAHSIALHDSEFVCRSSRLSPGALGVPLLLGPVAAVRHEWHAVSAGGAAG
jgi:hypothetical protein